MIVCDQRIESLGFQLITDLGIFHCKSYGHIQKMLQHMTMSHKYIISVQNRDRALLASQIHKV